MDFLDPKKKRAHRIKLFIGYGLMVIALGIGTMILFFQSYGYDLNPRTGEVIQNGLVFIDAHPESARAKLNGEDKGQTGLRLDMPAGDYELELSRDGYRTWKRSFTLEGSSIERFVYPFLFPEKLETADVQLYASTPGLMTGSPDRRWLVIQQPGSVTNFDLIDLSSESLPSTSIALPNGLLEAKGATHSLELVEWSTDNRRVMIKHNFEGGNEFFMLDIESVGTSVNLTKAFATPFTNLALRDKKFDQFYLYSQADQTVRTAELRTAQTTPLLTGVLTFKPHGNDVLIYVTTEGASEGKVRVRVREGNQDFTLRELPANSSYLVDVARFENAWYFVASSAAEQRTYVFRNPVSAIKRFPNDKPVPVGLLRLNQAPEFLSFSGNARFVAVQGGSQFSVYDAETDRQYRYDAGVALMPGQKAHWMDGHRLTLVADGKTVVFDYDGINKQGLSAGVSGTQPLFDRDYEALYNVAPSIAASGRFAITRTELRVEP